MRITSLRLDAESTALVERIAREEGKSRSEVLREALTQFGKRRIKKRRASTLYDRIKHVIGKADSGGLNLSENTGEKFTQMLEEERRARDFGGRRSSRRSHRPK